MKKNSGKFEFVFVAHTEGRFSTEFDIFADSEGEAKIKANNISKTIFKDFNFIKIRERE